MRGEEEEERMAFVDRMKAISPGFYKGRGRMLRRTAAGEGGCKNSYKVIHFFALPSFSAHKDKLRKERERDRKERKTKKKDREGKY